MSAFDDIAGLPPIGVWDGVLARSIEGAALSAAVVELTQVPSSRSTATRTSSSMVVSGSVRFRVGDERAT